MTASQTLRPLTRALCVCALLSSPWMGHAQEVYRCGNNYSSVPCAGGKAISTQPLVEIHTSSGPHSPYQQQRQEERDRERTERELDKAEFKQAPQRNTDNRQQCQAKKQRIEKIDDLARKGGSAKRMEQLREERQTARDWMFRAGC